MACTQDVADYDEVVQVAELTLQLCLKDSGAAHPSSSFAGGRLQAFIVRVR
jgi:hypothetical protein